MLQRLLIVMTALVTGLSVSGDSRAGIGSARAMMPSSMAWYLTGFELGQWEAYLASQLTPELASFSPVEVPRISWLKIDHDLILPEFAYPLLDDHRENGFSLIGSSITRAVQIGMVPGFNRSDAPGFERSMVFTGLARQLDNGNRLSVSAILASQQFSHSMLDVTRFDGGFAPVDFFAGNRELSQGTGVQFGFASEIAPALLMNASFQSRINMDELASVRGVHGFSADLDIPSRLRMGLDLRAGSHTLFTLAVSQVFYSQVGAFPSRALPARFNALLGDSTSPAFEWNDLTVYSFGMRWQHDSDLEFQFDFHTRSQPKPTAALLANALGDQLAQHSVMMGIGKGIGESARVDLSASYAPPEFAFGGNVLGIVSDRLDQAVEVAARLNIRF
ncbi:MAG: hypothetical protein RQ741_03575 [Wenzhouxiangellaceae bacterium]|nr:hypothetical protein [Wenzhouxiangellaceae bacterium]